MKAHFKKDQFDSCLAKELAGIMVSVYRGALNRGAFVQEMQGYRYLDLTEKEAIVLHELIECAWAAGCAACAADDEHSGGIEL